MTKVFRRPFIVILSSLGALACVSFAAVPLLSHQISRPVDVLMLVAVAGAISTLFSRWALAGLVASEDGVTVVNPISSRHLEWRDIDKFSVGSYAIYPYVVLVELKNRSSVHVWALQGLTWFTPGKKLLALVDELNSVLALRSESSPSTP
jgi:hypothetical protein